MGSGSLLWRRGRMSNTSTRNQPTTTSTPIASATPATTRINTLHAQLRRSTLKRLASAKIGGVSAAQM